MGLFNALNNNNVTAVRLMAIMTIPTTEDLLYALSMAKQARKPAELPFKNVHNGLNFVVRVAPGIPGTPQLHPRWYFERCDGQGQYGGNTQLWMRETSEVMMVQSKIKIEAAYTGEGLRQQQNEEYEETVEAQSDSSGKNPIVLPNQLITGSHQAIESTGENWLGSAKVSAANLPAMGLVQDLEPAEQGPTGIGTGTGAENISMSTTGTWLFTRGESQPVTLPPPVALNQDLWQNYIKALSNPETDFLRHSAFEFFLLRDSKYARAYGTKLSLLVFDFVEKQPPEDGSKKRTLALSVEAKRSLGRIMETTCGPLELFAQLRSGEYAVALNGYDSARALKFAEKICLALADAAGELEDLRDLQGFALGIAGLPDTCKDPGTLIAAASKAKEMAREAGQHYMAFPSF